jgi:hypothetical protein
VKHPINDWDRNAYLHVQCVYIIMCFIDIYIYTYIIYIYNYIYIYIYTHILTIYNYLYNYIYIIISIYSGETH